MTTYRIHDTPRGGFFSDFRATLSAVSELKKDGHRCNILWTNHFFQSDAKENIWEVFFHQIDQINPGDEVLDIRGTPLPREYSTRITINDSINKYVRLKDDVQEEIDSYIQNNFTDNTLGVHLRLTDKSRCMNWGEPETGTPVDLDLYKKHIEEYLNANENSSVFVSTDSNVGLNYMKDAFGEKVHCINAIRSDGEKSVHMDMEGEGSGIVKARDVLLDCLLLSKCNFIIKGISNVALCSLFFNKDLKSFNLNSHYRNDTREDFVNE